MFSVRCESCGSNWRLLSCGTFYEQQAIESKPCPGCGAYTLSCAQEKAELPTRLVLAAKRRARAMVGH